MGYIKVQTVCLVIIAIAAVKYLLPDIRKLCRMIGGEERKKVEKEPVKEPAAEPKNQEKKDNPNQFPDWEEKEEKQGKKCKKSVSFLRGFVILVIS